VEAQRVELAKRDAQIKEKDAEISNLKARLSQVEHVPAVMGTSAKPAAAAAGGSSQKRSRQGTTASLQVQCTC
jgi:C4-dicarboxylate-specific signal transduction histidine kinase